MKNMKKINELIRILFFIFSIFFMASSPFIFAEPMREGESLPSGYPLNQLPQSSAPSIIPENLPEWEPLQLPLVPLPPQPIARTPQPTSSDTQPTFSRSVEAAVGQQIEIPFSGSGWSYVGEMNGQKGVTYSSHRLEKEGQTFTFIAEETGGYALKFYKQDFIRDYTLNDYVQVTVTPVPAASVGGYSSINNRGTIVAEPRWPSAAQEAAIIEGGAGGVAVAEAAVTNGTLDAAQRAVQSADIVPTAVADAAGAETDPLLSDAAPDQFFKLAHAEFDTKNYAGVVSILEQFRAKYPNGADGDDEAWWLYAQACEANGPTKDIKTARYYYQRIVNEYPFSDHRSDAQNRIRYIDRYYIHIQ
ncbi:MAG: tetratricopeptide repeat protein [Treponema sp.]|jgi:TolA-binding protein|nr:tetratricopeptide repeat protein [Treponema sp.]